MHMIKFLRNKPTQILRLSHNYYYNSRYAFTTAQKVQKICYYKILNVSTNATFEEIRQSYLELAKKYHPDTSLGEIPQEEKFKEVSEAYRILIDPKSREKYDLENGIMNPAFATDEKFDSSFKNEDSYKEWISQRKKKAAEKGNDEELAAYFQNKYFNNKEVFKKGPADDDPFVLTKKLYNIHMDEKDRRDKEYVIYHPYTFKAYYEHKDDIKHGENRHIALKVLYDFRYIIVTSFIVLTCYCFAKGVKMNEEESKVIMSEYAKNGPGMIYKLTLL